MRVEPKKKSRNWFFNKNLHPVDPCPQNSITEVTLKSVYCKGQGKGGGHNEKVDKTFDFHKSFGKLQKPDGTFQQTHVLKLNLMVEFVRFYSKKSVIIKENSCRASNFSEFKIKTKFSQKWWYLFIKRTRVMLLVFSILKITINICWTLSSNHFENRKRLTSVFEIAEQEGQTLTSFFFTQALSSFFSNHWEDCFLFFLTEKTIWSFSFPAFPSKLVISRRKLVKL